MAYTFDKKNAHVPSTHKTQYFEMMGDRALYHEGWVIATTPIRPPWDVTGPTTQDPANAYKWELYNVAKDWTQFTDLSSLNPEKVKELQELLWIEMAKYQVLPLDASVASRLIAPRPNLTAGKTEFIYTYPITGIPLGDAPSLLNTSYSIAAEIEIPKEGVEGMLATQGGRFGGWGFYVLKNKPVFLWNLVDLERLRWEGAQPLTAGKHTVEFTFKYDGAGAGTLAFNSFSGIGQGGLGELKVDGKVVTSQKMKHTLPLILQWDETFDIGSDTGTSVNDKDYQVPFTFTGKLTKLTLKLDPPKLSEAEEKLLKQEGQRNNKASE